MILNAFPPRRLLRQRLTSTLRTDADLEVFCLDFFPSTAARFARGMTREEKLSLLLESMDEREIEHALDQHIQHPPTANPVLAARTAAGADVALSLRQLEAPRRRRSTVPSTAGEPPFVGRDAVLCQIRAILAAHGLAIVYGGPGLGKSRLVKEYARQHADEYPGGTFFVRFSENMPPIDLARLLREFEPPVAAEERFEDACRRALGFVGGAGRALLIYDGIPDEQVLRDWLPCAGLDWHLLATSNFSDWSSSWGTIVCEPLTATDAVKLVGYILRDQTATAKLASTLVDRAGGITIELCASAHAAAAQLRKGRKAEVTAVLAGSTISSFAAPWALLSNEQQRLMSLACLFASTRVSAEPLCQVMESIGWSAAQVERNIDMLRGSGLATGYGDMLEIHQLVAKFVRTQGDQLVRDLRPAVFAGLAKVAEEFANAPGNLTLRAKLQGYDLRWSSWADLSPAAEELHRIGAALFEMGQFQEAHPWFAGAVEVAEKGDIHGRVDHESLGSSLHQVGYCLWSQGRFAEAQPWYQRAVQAKEKGDIHGRVDYERLGRSLHQVGSCLSNQGRLAEAQPWYQRAVEAQEKGDIYGRVDHDSRGRGLHEVGSCLSNQGRFVEARSQYQRAVEAKKEGDIYGRVDHDSLGRSLNAVGFCLSRQGRFNEAQPWHQRAVEAVEKGDIHGRVDHDSLGSSLHQVGYCLSSQGRFAEAQPWYQRAVEAKEKGDIHGRVDQGRLGRSLHQVGYCLSSQGRLAEAQPWYQRAVEAAEKGDIHGCIDHESLGSSMHDAGACLGSQGRFAEAQPWYQRAVEAKEKGDIHGRVDHESLGCSLHQVGSCLWRQGRFAEAQPWYQRAAEAKEKGDIHGCVDQASLSCSLDELEHCIAKRSDGTEAQI